MHFSCFSWVLCLCLVISPKTEKKQKQSQIKKKKRQHSILKDQHEVILFLDHDLFHNLFLEYIVTPFYIVCRKCSRALTEKTKGL